ncbi:THO complex subunit 7 [Mortierella alpina]|nr:THO complex subunit 7 [Mortierella alpina]
MDHDETIIRTRLSVNERPLRRLSTRFQKWTGYLTTGTEEEAEKGLQTFMLEVSQVELSLSKSNLVTDMAERERLHYDREQQEIEDSISKSQEELEILARELEEAKQERANKIEYDQLAVEVSKFPSRDSSRESIANLQAEILELEREAVQQSAVMELRRKQFYTALQNLQSIRESIQHDQQEEEKRLFLKRARHDDDVLGEEEEEEEEGFAETMEDVKPTVSSPAPAAVPNSVERVLSQDRHLSPSSRSTGSESPAMNGLDSTGTEPSGAEGATFVLDLQHSTTYDSSSNTPIGTPGRGHKATPTPPSRSLTGTPNPDMQ